MKHLTLVLSALICLAWFSCRQDPALPEPATYINDTTGIEIPSVPVDTPQTPPPNPADTILGTYKGTTLKRFSNAQGNIDTSYPDEVVIFRDSTDKYNTFHVRFPIAYYKDYTTYDTQQFTYSSGNSYTHVYIAAATKLMQFKVFPAVDSIYLTNSDPNEVSASGATFTGKK